MKSSHSSDSAGGRGSKILLILILIIIAFLAGVYVGRRYYGELIGSISRTAKTPVDALKSATEKSSDFLMRQEILAAIETSKTLPPEKKKQFRAVVEEAYKANSEGKITGNLLTEWQTAENLYNDGKKDGVLSDSELENVVAKFTTIVKQVR